MHDQPTLRVEPVTDATAPDWRAVHNAIIPPHPLSPDDVRERLTRHHLTLGYVGDTLVGNATVRPPVDGTRTATVIVRVLEPFRRRGLGSRYLDVTLDQARALGAAHVVTVVLAANTAGLAFALARRFVETDRYEVDGAQYVDLELTGT